MDADTLRRYLEFYQDLGIQSLYRQASPTVQPGQAAGLIVAGGGEIGRESGLGLAGREPGRPAVGGEAAGRESGASGVDREAELIPIQEAATELPGLAPQNDTLLRIIEDIGDCRRCGLHSGRHKIVFGVGNEQAKLVFVGEGPGADEDAQGIPFVGRAGQLLTQMIENTSKKEGIPLLRKDVYICNVVKCRPPENRKPEPDEMQTCGQFLFRQLEVLKPKAICALGGTAAQALLGTRDGVTRLRGKWHKWRGIPLMVTYHPSYLLRPYNQDAKREAWEDLKKVLHFVYD